MKKQLGFSLLEIIAAFGIMVIIGLIGTINFSSYFSNIKLNNSAKYLIGKLKLAQQYTVTTQQKHAIKMDIFSNTYQLIKTEPAEQILETLNLDDNIIFNLFTGIQNNQVIFNSAGAVDYSGEIIILNSLSGDQVKIYIKPSGYVTWEKIN